MEYNFVLDSALSGAMKCRPTQVRKERRSGKWIVEVEYEGGRPGPWVYKEAFLAMGDNRQLWRTLTWNSK